MKNTLIFSIIILLCSFCKTTHLPFCPDSYTYHSLSNEPEWNEDFKKWKSDRSDIIDYDSTYFLPYSTRYFLPASWIEPDSKDSLQFSMPITSTGRISYMDFIEADKRTEPGSEWMQNPENQIDTNYIHRRIYELAVEQTIADKKRKALSNEIARQKERNDILFWILIGTWIFALIFLLIFTYLKNQFKNPKKMQITNQRIEVTLDMLQKEGMTKDANGKIGVPENGELTWKALFEMEDEDFDKIEEYFLAKQSK